MRWSSELLETSTCGISQTARCLSTSQAAMISASLQACPLAKHCTSPPGAELIGNLLTSTLSELNPPRSQSGELLHKSPSRSRTATSLPLPFCRRDP